MKKKSLVLLLAGVCLLTVGCGKDKEEEKSSKNENVRVLTCVQGDDENRTETIVEQDKKTNEITKYVMKISVSTDAYIDFGYKEDEIPAKVCEDVRAMGDGRCAAKVKDGKVIAELEFDPKEFEEDIIDDVDMKIDKIDENTFEKIKKFAEESQEEDNASMICTIS